FAGGRLAALPEFREHRIMECLSGTSTSNGLYGRVDDPFVLRVLGTELFRQGSKTTVIVRLGNLPLFESILQGLNPVELPLHTRRRSIDTEFLIDLIEQLDGFVLDLRLSRLVFYIRDVRNRVSDPAEQSFECPVRSRTTGYPRKIRDTRVRNFRVERHVFSYCNG